MSKSFGGSFSGAPSRETVFMLRRVLQTDETTADFIVTVPGHGHRFVAPVTAA